MIFDWSVNVTNCLHTVLLFTKYMILRKAKAWLSDTVSPRDLALGVACLQYLGMVAYLSHNIDNLYICS